MIEAAPEGDIFYFRRLRFDGNNFRNRPWSRGVALVAG